MSIKTKTVTDFFINDKPAWAAYDATRKLPSFIDGLKNSDYDFIPLSNEAIRNEFGYLEIIDLNREVDENSIVITILTAYDPNYDYDYDYYKTVFIINKTPVKDQFYCLYNYYKGYEYGSEYLEWSADDNIFTLSEYVSWE